MQDRLVLPQKLKKPFLENFHESHLGIVKTKSLARNYLWWHRMASDIEKQISQCHLCQLEKRKAPTKATVISWPETSKPMERVQVDLVGPIAGRSVLIMVDDYTKWPDAIIMKNTISEETSAHYRKFLLA